MYRRGKAPRRRFTTIELSKGTKSTSLHFDAAGRHTAEYHKARRNPAAIAVVTVGCQTECRFREYRSSLFQGICSCAKDRQTWNRCFAGKGMATCVAGREATCHPRTRGLAEVHAPQGCGGECAKNHGATGYRPVAPGRGTVAPGLQPSASQSQKPFTRGIVPPVGKGEVTIDIQR